MKVYKAEYQSTKLFFPVMVYSPKLRRNTEKFRASHIRPEAFIHKEYPECRCGRHFVPRNESDKRCLFCRKRKTR